MLPSGAAFRHPVIHDDQASQRIGPPPTREGIEADTHQYSSSESGIDYGDARFRSEHRIAKLATSRQLTPRQ